MSAGRRRAEKAPTALVPVPALLPLGGAVVAAAAWLLLVVWAVRWGQASRWVLAVVATVAAVGCLLMVFALVRATWAAMLGAAAPRRTPGRRRRQ